MSKVVLETDYESNQEDNNLPIKEEKNTSQIIIDIKKHDLNNDLLSIKDKSLNLEKLTYSAKEIQINENKYRLSFSFNEPVNISMPDIKLNIEGEPMPECSFDREGIRNYDVDYTNIGFTILLIVQKDSFKGKGPENKNVAFNEYSASMESYKKVRNDIQIKDLTKFKKDVISIARKSNEDQTLEYLIQEIKQKKPEYAKDEESHIHLFCSLEKNVITKIYNEKEEIKQDITYFYAPKIYSKENNNKSSQSSHVRCLFVDKNNYLYLLEIYDGTQVSQIFKRIREIIKKYLINNIEDSAIEICLFIKLCFLNNRIQLNEKDKHSLFNDIAQSFLYPFSNYKDCQDLYLRVEYSTIVKK